MRHVIMGTAGHVDHGKTALIKALTGFDCDTHKEEKRRGITINLGFSHLEITPELSIGIVDVPGHSDFINTMVSGASGIDFVLLLIAADAGVMPQTVEHLQIMKTLGIQHGMIVISKCDLDEGDGMIGVIREEIKDLTCHTFLKNSPVLEVSSLSGQGILELKENILATCKQITEKPADGIFRMYVDRVFSKSGFGTVVTGSVINGILTLDSTAYLLPGKAKEVMVRRLERHGKEVEQIRAGDRASINLAKLSRDAVKKGMVISDRILPQTRMADVRLELFKGSAQLGLWSQVIFHTGSFETQARLHIINSNRLSGGETGLFQVQLQDPTILRFGDRFVIRNSSREITLGGGEVIDPAPLFHRRRPEVLIKNMTAISQGGLTALIADGIRKAANGISDQDLALKLNFSKAEINVCLRQSLPADIFKFQNQKGTILYTSTAWEKLSSGIQKAIKEFKLHNPLLDRGAGINDIRSSQKIIQGSAAEELLKIVLQDLIRQGKVVEKNSYWYPAQGRIEKSEKASGHEEFFSRYLKNCAMQTPLMSSLTIEAKKRNLSERSLKQILTNLKASGELYMIQDHYLSADIVNSCREKLEARLNDQADGISVSEFRDLVKGNRKICLLLLSQFDSELLTRRVGDLRVLTKKRR